jgi:drug/metabolite transporter (DMT)-like permease
VNLDQEETRDKRETEVRRQADLIIFLALLVICIGWLILTFRLPFKEQLTWPGFLPLILLIGILCMVGAMLLYLYVPNREYRNMRHLGDRALQGLRNTQGTFYRGLLTVAILGAYILLLGYLPSLLPPTYSYIISTAIFIMALLMAFKAAPLWLVGLVAIVTTGALYFIFGSFYRVPLP